MVFNFLTAITTFKKQKQIMKSVKFKTLAIVALFSLAVASCNKKDDPDPVDENVPAEVGFAFKTRSRYRPAGAGHQQPILQRPERTVPGYHVQVLCKQHKAH